MSDGMKKVIHMLEDEVNKMSYKNDVTPNDFAILKDVSKSLYYLTVICAMNEGSDSDSYGRRPYYDTYGEDYGRMRDSRGRYMGDGGRSYGHMDKSEEKMYLEKMLQEARSDTEREIFRRKLDELNRQM